jgi:hypothetical protein
MFTMQHHPAQAVPEECFLQRDPVDEGPCLQVFVKIFIYKEMLSCIIKRINYSRTGHRALLVKPLTLLSNSHSCDTYKILR